MSAPGNMQVVWKNAINRERERERGGGRGRERERFFTPADPNVEFSGLYFMRPK